MNTNVFNSKTKEVENKIPDHTKYVATPELKKFAGSLLDLE